MCQATEYIASTEFITKVYVQTIGFPIEQISWWNGEDFFMASNVFTAI